MRPHLWTLALLCAAFSLFQSACYEEVKGCLDPAALNFNPDADRDCCCEYPFWALQVDQFWGDQPWRPNVLFTNNLGQPMYLQAVDLYLHGFYALRDQQIFRVNDQITLRLLDQGQVGQETFVDDFVLLRWPPSGALRIGAFRMPATFDEVGLALGLPATASMADPQSAPATHPLGQQNVAAMYDSTRMAFHACIIRLATPAPDSAVYTLRFSAEALQGISVSGQGPFVQREGANLNIRLRADYARLFEGLDLSTADISAWKLLLTDNLRQTFSVLP